VFDALQFDFMRYALLAGVLASIACGIVGTFIIVKRLVFVSGGISHAAFGGLGMCYFLGWPPLFGAFLMAALVAFVLGRERFDSNQSNDAAIGVLWSVGMALGIVFIAKTPGYAPNLMSYLFGDILTVTLSDVVAIAVLDGVLLLVLALLYKELLAISFDSTFAQVQQIPVRFLQTLLLLLVGATVVVLIQVVGIVLVLALLSIPTLVSLRFTHRFARVIVLSMFVSLVLVLVGFATSFYFDLPTGPSIVLCGALMLGIAEVVDRGRVRLRRVNA